MFYCYNQNNSGGNFDFQKGRISHYVIIEADNADAANWRAEDIGIYFDGCVRGRDCDCCGDRWNRAWSHEGKNVPSIYNTPVEDYRDNWLWMGGKPEGYIHYADGTVEPFSPKEEKDW